MKVSRYYRNAPRQLPERVAGIPCVVAIHDYTVEPETPEDPGRVDMDYVICDQRGRPAPWLERKLTPTARAALEERVVLRLTEAYSL